MKNYDQFEIIILVQTLIAYLKEQKDGMFFGLKRSTRFTQSIQSMPCQLEGDEAVQKWRL